MIRLLLITCLLSLLCPAQYRRGRQPDINSPAERLAAADFEGIVRGATNKEVVIETADGNTMQFRITRKTSIVRGKDNKVKASEIQAGMKVTVEAVKAPDNSLDAVRIELPGTK